MILWTICSHAKTQDTNKKIESGLKKETTNFPVNDANIEKEEGIIQVYVYNDLTTRGIRNNVQLKNNHNQDKGKRLECDIFRGHSANSKK